MSEPSIFERIQKDLVVAMKAKDADSTSTLRMLKAALMEEKTRKAKDAVLDDEQERAVLKRYLKQRREALAEWTKAGEMDRRAREEAEIKITQHYLPQELGATEVNALVEQAIKDTGAAGPKDTGKVIGAVMAKAKGLADGKLVAARVKEKLSG